jgi:hypothetical protein
LLKQTAQTKQITTIARKSMRGTTNIHPETKEDRMPLTNRSILETVPDLNWMKEYVYHNR